MALREIQIVALVAAIAALLAMAQPSAIAEAELHRELQAAWAEYYAVTGGQP